MESNQAGIKIDEAETEREKNMSETMNLQVNKNLEHLKKKKLFLFDIDGTIALSEDVIEGTFQLLSYIREIGGRAIYIT